MGSVKLVKQGRHVHFQKGTKSDADTIPEPKDKAGWYYSEFGGGWYKTVELVDKERRERAEKNVW